MIKVQIVSVGKSKEEWLRLALGEYEKRLSKHFQILPIWCKDDQALLHQLEGQRGVLALDPEGELLDSVGFADRVKKEILQAGSRLTFVIGGPEGLPESVRKSFPLLSLSKLTFTHQMTRLILLEQLYRSYTIWNKTPYHK